MGCIEWGGLALPANLAPAGRDAYQTEALGRKTKFCRLLWRMERGVRRWYAQLVQEGLPPRKHETAEGEVVGLDVGPSTVAMVSETAADVVKFCATVEQPWREVRRLQRALDRSRRATNPDCFNPDGRWKRGKRQTVFSGRYQRLRTALAEAERVLAAERKRAHGELANAILSNGSVIQTERLSYRAFQKQYGRSVKVRAPGMFIDLLRRKAGSADGELVELDTGRLKLSQYDHRTRTCEKKPLSQRWHVLGDGSGIVQRDVYSAFLARCVIGNTHHPFHIEAM